MKLKLHELHDVRPVRITVCKQGANRQVWFLRKAERDDLDEDTVITLTEPSEVIIKSDWSAVYCVVAAPGETENGGLLAPDVEDRWASEDEIRKAAHYFMANGDLSVGLHDAVAEYGAVVENAVAPATFSVEGPDGSKHKIRKGSWYVALQPNPEGRAKIEAGEFNGISIEGTGQRTPVEKSDPEPEPAAEHDTLAPVKPHDGLLRRIAKAVGLTDEDVDAELAAAAVVKSQPTFSELRAERELDDELPQAFSVLREVVWQAFHPHPDDENAQDPSKVIGTSLDEFKAWALDLVKRTGVKKGEGKNAPTPRKCKSCGATLAKDASKCPSCGAAYVAKSDEEDPEAAEFVAAMVKAFGDPPAGLIAGGGTTTINEPEGDTMLTEQETKRIEDLEKSVEEIGKGVTTLVKAQEAAAKPEPPTVEDIGTKFNELVEGPLTEIAKALETLTEGDSTQTGDDNPVKKGEGAADTIGLLA